MSEDNSECSIDKTNDPTQQQLEGYNFMKTLGKGNFGKVKLGVHILTGQYVAIKILEKDLIFEKADIERISRQIKIMKLIRHTNIIQLYQIIQKPKRLYLIMEYADGGDLFDLIVKNEKLTQKNALNYFAQVLLGLEYLHGKGVAHRDMKPENILISKGKIKIADFGLGNFFNQGEMLKTACGSPCYASPEMLQRVPYNPEKIDIWSSGIILYAMVCGYLPFEDEVTTKLYEKIKNNSPRYPKFLSENIKTILKKVLDKNPQTRATITQLKTDPSLKTQFQQQQSHEFDIDMIKLNKICQIYGINQQQKLTNYLRKNKHNNLTTIYYLASKSKNDENIRIKPQQAQVKYVNYVETHRRNSDNMVDYDAGKKKSDQHDVISQTSINQGLKQQKMMVNQHPATSNPEALPQKQVIFQQTQSLIQNPDQNIRQTSLEVQKKDSIVQNPTKNSGQRQSKISSIKGDISFSQLEQFSNSSINDEKEYTPAPNTEISQPQPQPQQQPSQGKQPSVIKNDIKETNKNQIKIGGESKIKQTKITPTDKKQVNRVLTNQNQSIVVINQSNFVKDKINKSGKKPQENRFQKRPSLNQQRIDKDKNSKISNKSSMNTSKTIKEDHQNQQIKEIEKQPMKKSQNVKKKIEKKQSIRGQESTPALNMSTNSNNPIKIEQVNKSYDGIKGKDSPTKNRSFQKQQEQKKAELKNSSKDLQKYFYKKPKLVKTGRMEMLKSTQPQPNRKPPPLYERSHSRDKTLTTKKIIGKLVTTEPFLIDASKLVLCPWQIFSSILTQKGAEGRVEYYSYGKTCIYISKSSLKGIRNLRELIQKINTGQIQ